MHYWGDEWFQKYGDELYAAIHWLWKEMHHCGIIYVNKEKFGCNDVEHVQFWDGSLYWLLFGYCGPIGTSHNYHFEWCENLANRFHYWLYYKFDRAETHKKTIEKQVIENKKPKKWKGFIHYMSKFGILDRVVNWQKKQYNKIYQKACKKWPNIIDELISDDSYGCEYIKPGKYGSVDGMAIHKKYWKRFYGKPSIEKIDISEFTNYVDASCNLDADSIESWKEELKTFLKTRKHE